MFKRDKKRFASNINYIEECPLGVGALAGTSYKIDRNFTSKKLGFKKPTNNSIDTVSDRDFVLDFFFVALLMNLLIFYLINQSSKKHLNSKLSTLLKF